MNTDTIKRDLLIFNGKAYAELGTPLLPSCNGYFEMKGHEGVHLYERDGTLSAFIVDNKRQGQFVVTAHMTPEGPRYMQDTDDIVTAWLGLTRGGRMEKQAIADKAIVARERLEWMLQGDRAAETGPNVPALPPPNDLQMAVAQRDALCTAAHDLLVCEFKAWRFSGFQDRQIMAMPYLKPLLQAVEAATGRPFSMEDEVTRPRERMQG